MAQDMERNVEMEITIKVGEDMLSTKKFKLYEGTEMVYGQAVDLAVTAALAKVSKVAYDIIDQSGDDVPAAMAVEAVFGKAYQAAS